MSPVALFSEKEVLIDKIQETARYLVENPDAFFAFRKVLPDIPKYIRLKRKLNNFSISQIFFHFKDFTPLRNQRRGKADETLFSTSLLYGFISIYYLVPIQVVPTKKTCY